MNCSIIIKIDNFKDSNFYRQVSFNYCKYIEETEPFRGVFMSLFNSNFESFFFFVLRFQ